MLPYLLYLLIFLFIYFVKVFKMFCISVFLFIFLQNDLSRSLFRNQGYGFL